MSHEQVFTKEEDYNFKKTFDKNKCPVVHKTALTYISSYSIYEEPGFRIRFLI